MIEDEKLEVFDPVNHDDPKGDVVVVELSTHAEILQKCDELILNLVRQVRRRSRCAALSPGPGKRPQTSMLDMDVTTLGGRNLWRQLRVTDGVEVYYKPTSANMFHCYMAR